MKAPSKHRFIPVAHPVFAGNEKKYVTECIDTLWISSAGRFIAEFEADFAAYCGVKYAVSTNNGTTALHLAMLALGLAPGDEVIVPTMTYIASANAVTYCGATPVFVDSEPETLNIDPQLIEAAITPKTKGIMVVHLYGHPAAMDAISAIAEKHGLWIVEDAAEALGATYDGTRVGGFGRCATFSFFGNKTITTGEGGMLVTDDATLAARARLLRGQGMDLERRYWFTTVGYNYRMTNIEAALGLAQLENIDVHLEHRQKLASWYDRALSDCADTIVTPVVRTNATHSFWMYTIQMKGYTYETRDALMSSLRAENIETRPAFYPMHVMPPYYEASGAYPVAERFAKDGICLPTHGLVTEEDVDYIAKTLMMLISRAL